MRKTLYAIFKLSFMEIPGGFASFPDSRDWDVRVLNIVKKGMPFLLASLLRCMLLRRFHHLRKRLRIQRRIIKAKRAG